MSNNIELINYSEKAIAVFGDTKDYRESLASAGGMFNPSLKYKDGRSPGWVFSKSKKAAIEALLQNIFSGKVSKSVTPYETSATTSGAVMVDKKAFLALASRVERLEQELTLISQKFGIKPPTKSINSQIIFEDGDEDEDDEDEKVKPKRLLKKM